MAAATFFAPQLFIPSGVMNTNFYRRAFGAAELRRWNNDDGSIHVAELEINGALFHLHEASPRSGLLNPEAVGSSTVLIGLFVPDVDTVVARAQQAGATILMPATDFDYGYRQAQLRDAYGHVWMIEAKIA